MTDLTRRRPGLIAASSAVPNLLARPALAQGAKEVITFAGVTLTEAGRGDKLRTWVDGFNKSQDRVDVQPIGMPFATLANTVFTQMGGGGGPDIVRFDQIDYYAAIEAKRLLPLGEILATGKYRFTEPNGYLDVVGRRYGVVFFSSNYVLLSNKALIATPPGDFDSLLAAAKAATGNGNYGFACRATMAKRPGFRQDLCNAVYGFGGRWSNGKDLRLNSPAVVSGIEAYKRIYESGALPKGATLRLTAACSGKASWRLRSTMRGRCDRTCPVAVVGAGRLARFTGTPPMNLLAGMPEPGGLRFGHTIVPHRSLPSLQATVFLGIRPGTLLVEPPGTPGTIAGQVMLVEHIGAESLITSALPRFAPDTRWRGRTVTRSWRPAPGTATSAPVPTSAFAPIFRRP